MRTSAAIRASSSAESATATTLARTLTSERSQPTTSIPPFGLASMERRSPRLGQVASRTSQRDSRSGSVSRSRHQGSASRLLNTAWAEAGPPQSTSAATRTARLFMRCSWKGVRPTGPQFLRRRKRREGCEPGSGGAELTRRLLLGGPPPPVGHELVEKARLPSEEAFGVEGVAQLEALVVEVMTHLVEQRAQEGPELHHPAMASGAHPELDPRGAAAVPRVQAVQLAPARAGTRGQDLHRRRRDPEHLGQPPA